MKIFTYHGMKNVSGSRVRKARRALKLSQTELAAQLQIRGVSLERDTISRMEMGDRIIADYELRTLAEILKVDVAWLLDAEGEEEMVSRAAEGRGAY
ncbi:helix-turn-helix domain-containing protein [Oscillibacter sp. MSJ-2]|uniref:Helix-turn-helix domain-containing protein n=1 Tax=Dysosmobacter acutus TaxID=2841504 RepID=A0ABS6FBJ6_9FIRM|nr:helix-turn-helix transcriptional regulator [Dysosmobacter acutus]MBU5626932.1 helix-turn-helix domain-containing protein [Dysosmobacter acutus]MBU5627106.1 helix-turn-helix domain-containing protein [Dysosmobacter acutus]